jgi:hypothetical protein
MADDLFYCDFALCEGHISNTQECSLSSSLTIKEIRMPKNITVTVPTLDDAAEKLNDVRETVTDTVEETVENVEEKVNALSTVKQVVVFTSAVIVGFSVVSAVARRLLSRNEQVIEGEVIVVTPDEVLNA